MVSVEDDANERRPSAAYGMEDVRRARELYRYIQPANLVQPHLRRRDSTFDVNHEHVPSLNAALGPFCQLAALRCNATKAMLNVMDRDVMYFLAESYRKRRPDGDVEDYEFVEDPIFMSCSSVPLKGRICELTIKSDGLVDKPTPFFVVPDLTKSQFSHMAIVSGPPYYRFYAGVPITTRGGINIGSVAIMDTKPRPDGLTRVEEEFLSQIAQQVMTYLETNKQAIEGRRSRRMANGLAAFIAGQGSITDASHDQRPRGKTTRPATMYGVPITADRDLAPGEMNNSTRHPRYDRRNLSIVSIESNVSTSEFSTENEEQQAPREGEKDSRSHARTFARAANLLRECMGDLGEEGSVCFQSLKARFGGDTDASLAAQPTQQANPLRAASPLRRIDSDLESLQAMPTPAKLIAYSTLDDAYGLMRSRPGRLPFLTEARLQDLTRRYPNGHLWSLEDTTYSSSEEDGGSSTRSTASTLYARRTSTSKRKVSELNAIRTAFPGARQVLFTPLWDATIGSYAHGVFVSTTLEARSFDATSELSFLNAFCSTLMAECSRLDTMLADKQKSDFVGTISHEMRSPLHGVLASVEFLSETDVTGFQRSLVDTIDSCGRTLLDTINHVLDFSKVNSFQKQWQASNQRTAINGQRNHYLGPENSTRSLANGAPPLLQLFAVTDISAVLEEVVDGLVVGQTFNSGIDITDTSRDARGKGSHPAQTKERAPRHDPVDIVLDVEHADWSFLTQPGAVRRIIMNITGNAIKYTPSGSIIIRLRLQEHLVNGEMNHAMILTVTDSGKGISPEFLATKLFVPFAQENALAPGTGLGLSIVRSIILMLGGTIDVKSTVGKGTAVEVTLPLKRPMPGQVSTQSTPSSASTSGSATSLGSFNAESVLLLQKQAADATVTFYRSQLQENDQRATTIQLYVTDWYRLQFVDIRMVASVSVVVVEEEDLEELIEHAVGTPGRRPAIVVLCSVASRHSASLIKSYEDRVSSAIEFVAKPIGPYKLARSMRLALEKKKEINPRFPQVTALGVIDEKPTPHPSMSGKDELTAINGDLSDMDLNAPGENDAKKIVQANETFAASQNSEHAQKALNDPHLGMQTPQVQSSEGSAFPFPAQDNESSRQRRETPRTNSLPVKTYDPLRTPKPQDKNFRPSLDLVDPHVLLVDDNKINLKLLETFLKSKRKYTRVVQAEDGLQAVNAVMASKEPFDIIFMDISMPIMNGFEATRAIRNFEERGNAKPGAMIIALTGLASGRDQSEGFESGCDIYMTKPVSFKEVGKLLNNWEEHQKVSVVSNGVGTPTDSSAVPGT